LVAMPPARAAAARSTKSAAAQEAKYCTELCLYLIRADIELLTL
jgi:hypothetical protein